MMKLTYEIAHAISMDVGNASMRKGKRMTWNLDDRNAAIEMLNRLLDILEKENKSCVN